MASDKVVMLIISICLNVLNGTHGAGPLHKPSGNWYVVAADKYNNTLPIPKCWTINVFDLSDNYFGGFSTFSNKENSEQYQVSFNGTRYGRYSDSRVIMHHFDITVTYGDHQTLAIRTISLINIRSDKVTAHLSEISIGDQKWNYFDKLYISRDPILPISYSVGQAMRIDNTNCTQDQIVLGSSEFD